MDTLTMEISTRASQLNPSLTLSIDSKAKAMKSEGIDICGFGAGEPDFDTPEHIKQAAIAALEAGFTKYTPSSGLPELRQAIAEKFADDNGLEYRPSQVIVSNGAKHSCYNAILATCETGDEVIIPSPYWVSYPDMVRLAGAEPVIVQTSERNGWKMTAQEFENAMTPRTKMVIMNSPNNPTGSVYTREELEAIVEVAAEEDIYILSDEIYEKLVYDDAKHVSIASLSKQAYDLTITINGFSKSYAMTGWRLGYMGAPENDRQGGRFHPKPQHFESLLLRAKGRDRRAQGRPAAALRHARRVRYAAQLHVRSHLEDREHHRGQAAGRVLHSGQHQPARLDLAEFRRPAAEQGQRRRHPGRGFRRRSHHPAELRDQHRHHQEGSRSVPGFLPHAVDVSLCETRGRPAICELRARASQREASTTESQISPWLSVRSLWSSTPISRSLGIPEHEDFLEEDWLFEAITETYLRSSGMMRRLREDGVPFKLTMSLTPTLGAMLRDELLQERYLRHLDRLIALAQQEIARNRRARPAPRAERILRAIFHRSARHFSPKRCSATSLEHFASCRKAAASKSWRAPRPTDSSLCSRIFPRRSGRRSESVATAIAKCSGVNRAVFGCPSVVTAPGLDAILQEANIRWFVVDTHGLMFGKPRPRYALFAPCYTPAGPAAFAARSRIEPRSLERRVRVSGRSGLSRFLP